MLSGPQAIVSELNVRFAATPDGPWPFIADTTRFNKAVGLPPVIVRTLSDDGEMQSGEIRAFCVAYDRWTEHPFEWQRPRGFSVNRDFLSGPLARPKDGAERTLDRRAHVAPVLR